MALICEFLLSGITLRISGEEKSNNVILKFKMNECGMSVECYIFSTVGSETFH